MNNRVVVTGLGVLSPNGISVEEFTDAIKNGKSGIKHDKELESLNFSCQISGKPELTPEHISNYFTPLEMRSMESTGIIYGVIASMDAWKDAGLDLPSTDEPDWDSGTVFGTGTSGVEKFKSGFQKIESGQARKLGSGTVSQIMASGVSAFIGGKLGLGNQVTTNSSACSTGTEAVILAYERIKSGQAVRMVAGSTCDSGPYVWGGFDAMKVCTYKHNAEAERGSRPMSATASGFAPSAGAGALVLESLDSALSRGATIYAEILGGAVNSGGQRGQGSMTAPNPTSVQKCIELAIKNAAIDPNEIDTINGHLTATAKDSLEIENWAKVLNRYGSDFPPINTIKGMIGHSLSATGSIETIASVLELYHGFIFPNINCEDLNPEIEKIIAKESIPTTLIHKPISILAKANFGFGDVNACLILKKYTNE